MGRCATCGKRIGLFGRKWRKVSRARHCVPCLPAVVAQRRETTLAAILADPAPRVLFVAPVISRDLDYPSNHRRYTGVLLLADKGVIFAQYGEYRKAHSNGALFGLVGALIDAAVEKGRREAASDFLSDTNTDDGMAVLAEAEQLFFFEATEIKTLKGDSTFVQLKTGEGKVPFRWLDGRKAMKPHRRLIDAYVRAVNSGRDVVADCEDFLGG